MWKIYWIYTKQGLRCSQMIKNYNSKFLQYYRLQIIRSFIEISQMKKINK